MPRSHQCSKRSWGPGQHHCCDPRGGIHALSRTVILLALAFSPPPALPQNLLHIRIVEGEGTILAAGGRCPKGIIVEITDETGRPVDNAAVSFRMPEEGPGASFDRGMRTEIRTTTPDGRASVHDYVANRLSGPYQVRVTVVKNGVRAGTILSQYVSDAPVRSEGVRSSRKLILLVAIAGGAATAGFFARRAMRTSTPAEPAVPPPSIGTPTFTVGGP